MKKYRVLCWMIAMMLLFTGCAVGQAQGGEAQIRTAAGKVFAETPETIEYTAMLEKYNFSVSGAVSVPREDTVYAIDSQMKPWVDETVATAFFDGEYTAEDITNPVLADTWDEYLLKNLKFTNEAGDELDISTVGQLCYHTPEGEVERHFVSMIEEDSMQIPVQEEKDLAFASRQETKMLLEDQMKKMGLPQIASMKIGSMSTEKLNSLYALHKDEIDEYIRLLTGFGKVVDPVRQSWSSDEEFYMVQGYFDYHGVPYADWFYTHQQTERAVPISGFIAYVNKNGIQYMDIQGVYMEKNASPVPGILTVQEAMDKLEAHCRKADFKDYEFDEVSFAYVAVPEAETKLGYELRPCWVFDYSHYSGAMAVDAVTGEIADSE